MSNDFFKDYFSITSKLYSQKIDTKEFYQKLAILLKSNLFSIYIKDLNNFKLEWSSSDNVATNIELLTSLNEKLNSREILTKTNLSLIEKEWLMKNQIYDFFIPITKKGKCIVFAAFNYNGNLSSQELIDLVKNPLNVTLVENSIEIYLTKYEKLKNDFLNKINHELRTPMNSILGSTDLILKKFTTISAELKTEILQIKESSNSLMYQINNIVNLSNTKQEHIKIEQHFFNLNDVIAKIKNKYEQLTTIKNLDFFINNEVSNPNIYSDPIKLFEIIDSLLDNSVKFTNNGFVSLSIHNKNKNQLRIDVKDSGIGISPDVKDKIFNSFSQCSVAENRNLYGLGISLCLSQHIIKELKGTLGFDSIEEQGSNFWIELPIKTEELKEIQNTWTGNILVVEDNVINQRVITNILESLGFNVSIANNGKEAVGMYKNNTYPIILMDCQMPVMDGFEATENILKINPNQKIVAFTANAHQADKDKCLNYGMVDFIQKPVNIEHLLSVLEKHISFCNNVFDEDCLLTNFMITDKKDNESIKFINDLINQFYQTIETELTQVEKEILNNNVSFLNKKFHTYKSTFATFGLNKAKLLFSIWQKQESFNINDFYTFYWYFLMSKIVLNRWIEKNNRSVA
jgi:signal transduction histidine kinase/DNA-binding response OmpR family regulator